ncbi:MAG TPA: DUF2905 domain-containing protein [Terriglobales bacterium]|nr:DUF2905 domain-containing protein [Terriglobales bacterium]
MADIGKLLVFFGALVLLFGVILVVAGRTHIPIGRLPGDIVWRGKHTIFYFPLATSIILSVVLSLLFYLFGRFGGGR